MKNRAALVILVTLAGWIMAGTAQAGPLGEAQKASVAELRLTSTTEGEDGAQADDHLFDAIDKLGAKAKGSNEVNLDKSMLGLAARKGGEKGDLAQKLDYIVVRDYSFAHDNDYNMGDLKPIFQKLDGAGWKHLVRSREDKEMTDVCVRQDSEGVTKEMVIISAQPRELSLVHLKGNVSLSDMKNFGSLLREDQKLNHH